MCSSDLGGCLQTQVHRSVFSYTHRDTVEALQGSRQGGIAKPFEKQQPECPHDSSLSHNNTPHNIQNFPSSLSNIPLVWRAGTRLPVFFILTSHVSTVCLPPRHPHTRTHNHLHTTPIFCSRVSFIDCLYTLARSCLVKRD